LSTRLLKESTLYKLAEFKFYNLFEISTTNWSFILYQCASNESKKIWRSSFRFDSL